MLNENNQKWSQVEQITGRTESTRLCVLDGNPIENKTVLLGNVLRKNVFITTISLDLDITHDTVIVNGDHTITLPTAVGISGKEYKIKVKTNISTTGIHTKWNQTIDGVNYTVDFMPFNTQNSSITLISDGSNWLILDLYQPST